ncbi:MAG: hypothetical protein H7Z41_13355 [Cytophagales bacterium]|nr:hypothetical protein [Armatimonadota bacterium]
MPEGPEVRRYAQAIHSALSGQPIASLTARTKAAKAYLAAEEPHLIGRRIERVFSHGKNLIGQIEGGYYFYSHLMMWGSWRVLPHSSPFEVDRRERARIVVLGGATAILVSAPIFEVGHGNPLNEIAALRHLGPDILPYPCAGHFAASCFLERLLSAEHRERAIGAALLDQTIAAGIGNYLRAEILFRCRINPFVRAVDLPQSALQELCQVIPEIASRALEAAGVTVSEAEQQRIRGDRSLLYPNGTPEWGSRHAVFRRTNLPCLNCGVKIQQKRQVTRQLETGEDKERIIYFCPNCQHVEVGPK